MSEDRKRLRITKGVPTGGEFATEARADSEDLTTSFEETQAELRGRIRDLLAYEGVPMRAQRSQYGWVDSDAKMHQFTTDCGWVLPERTVLEEESWSEFENTVDGNTDHIGVQIPSGVRCGCGAITDTGLRWEGSLGALIRATTSERYTDGPTPVMSL